MWTDLVMKNARQELRQSLANNRGMDYLLRDLSDLFERPHEVTMDRVRQRHGPRCAALAELDSKHPRVNIDMVAPQIACLGTPHATPVHEHR